MDSNRHTKFALRHEPKECRDTWIELRMRLQNQKSLKRNLRKGTEEQRKGRKGRKTTKNKLG